MGLQSKTSYFTERHLAISEERLCGKCKSKRRSSSSNNSSQGHFMTICPVCWCREGTCCTSLDWGIQHCVLDFGMAELANTGSVNWRDREVQSARTQCIRPGCSNRIGPRAMGTCSERAQGAPLPGSAVCVQTSGFIYLHPSTQMGLRARSHLFALQPGQQLVSSQHFSASLPQLLLSQFAAWFRSPFHVCVCAVWRGKILCSTENELKWLRKRLLEVILFHRRSS